MTIETEPGVEIAVTSLFSPTPEGLAIILDMEGPGHAAKTDLVKAMAESRWQLFFVEPRATGERAVVGDTIGRAPDHNSAEWSIWTGRPLLGQWIWDSAVRSMRSPGTRRRRSRERR